VDDRRRTRENGIVDVERIEVKEARELSEGRGVRDVREMAQID
jgi:hypothetical protein